MYDVRNIIMRIADMLRNSFSDVLITGSYLMNKVFSVRVSPEGAINEAETLSSMFRDVALLIDDLGFLNSLGSLSTARIRGSLTIFVYDIHDIRPFCDLVGLPCLEPWDQDSLVKAVRESHDYSESFEIPYIVRLGPWLRVGEDVKGIGIKRREYTFNKNWSEPMRWGLNRLLGSIRRVVPEEVRVRSRDNVITIGSGDGTLVSGSAWPFVSEHRDKFSNYSLILSLYVNPLPRDYVSIKYVIDTGDYLARELGAEALVNEDLNKWYSDLVSGAVQQLFFRGPGDPLMMIEWLLSKYGSQGEVPVLVIDPAYAHVISTEGLTPSFDMIPTFFEPRGFDQLTDFITNPLAALLAFLRAGYDYGKVTAVVSPCTLLSHKELVQELTSDGGNYLIIIPLIGDECGDFVNLLSQVGAHYRVINYDPSNPLASLQDVMSITNSRGIVVLNVLAGSMGKYVFNIIDDYCDNCGDCLRINCPAIKLGKKPFIDAGSCVGCGICQLVCLRGAINRVKKS